MLEAAASGSGAARVNGRVPLFDVLNDPLLVNHERGALGRWEIRHQHSVFLAHLAREIAQEREFYADLIGESFVSGGTVYANPQNLRVAFLKFGDISLIRL